MRAPSPRSYFYQRSCGKVIFLHLSRILFTGVCVSGRHPPRQTPPWAGTPPPPQGDGHCSGLYAVVDLRGARGTYVPWGSKFFQFHAVFGKNWENRMLVPPREVGAPSSGKSWIRCWYASYWNAFLSSLSCSFRTIWLNNRLAPPPSSPWDCD